MPKRLATTSCLAVLDLLGAVPSFRAAESAPDPDRAIYLQYCGACHGPTGKGDGVAGSLITPKPADLTRIAQEHGGTFPFQGVIAYIDGSQDVRAHGNPTMPVWGERLGDEPAWDQGRRVQAQGKLMAIAEYIRSIQDK